MGRSKNGEVNRITVERLKDLRAKKGDKQEVIAKTVLKRRNVTQYGRYERGEIAIPDKDIIKLSHYYGVPPDYIRGITDTKDPTAYALELDEAGIDEYEAQQRAERTRRINFFDLCGFHYEDLHASPGPWEFAEEYADKAHKLSDSRGIIDPIELSENELSAVLDSVHDFIAFECFKLIQRRREAI